MEDHATQLSPTGRGWTARAAEAPAVLVDLIEPADVRFDGGRPWDIRVHDPELYRRVLRHGSLGFGEAYMDGLWDSDQLDELFHRLLGARIDRRVQGLTRMRLAAAAVQNLAVNRQSRRRAFEVGEQHYDIGNDVYTAMLDSTMSYSCGYWKDARDLEEAQQAKLRLACEKLELEPGMTLLDIGSGWGGLAAYAATHYGVRVTGITVSREQLRLAEARCRDLPVEFRLMDYRDLEGQFDRVVSVGMFEHVGPRNYDDFFATVDRVLAPGGLFLLHTIGDNQTTNTADPWIDRYIFPNGKLPSARQLAGAVEEAFVMEDWHNFGPDYDPTLMSWWHNFDAAWPELEPRYGERFYRMWKYYLHCCAGMFRSRQAQLWQVVLSRGVGRRPYRAPR